MFCGYYILSGVFRERRFELVAFAASVSVVLAYVILDFASRPAARSQLKLVHHPSQPAQSWIMGDG